jgi:membrane protein YdbS with pleckstrin-like domain
MFSRLRSWLLRVLRVPPEPEPPFGDPASTRIFRASPKFYSFRLLGWLIGQTFAFFGLVLGVSIMLGAEYEAAQVRAQQARAAALATQASNAWSQVTPAAVPAKSLRRQREPTQELAEVVARVPPAVFILFWILKLIGVLTYVTQLVLTYAALRLDYEMRWYVVTDRSLRIRSGLWKVQELTMSFANLQQVMVSQGPIQRLLGIADVRVQSAGGSSMVHAHQKRQGASMHTGYFHGVDNATEVRDLVLARLRHFRETGLGDPDEIRYAPPAVGAAPPVLPVKGQTDVLAAAQEVLGEARRLRSGLQAR